MQLVHLLHVLPAGLLVWPAVDAIARWLRLLSSDRQAASGLPVGRPLVVIPSRAEGLRMKPLCEDVLREGVVPVVILDGDDPAARAVLTALGARVLVKEPAGPTKGAALAWATEALGAQTDAASHVLVFDADMRLPEGYFEALSVPEGAAVFQGPVRPSGVPAAGAARVEALSTAVATLADDLARSSRGLPVRLRGKAMGFVPHAWRAGPGAGAVTTAEDSEFTFRLL
ncbi:MAG: glycosyltransferase family 2 protein, partial [Acidobacteria bacterium]|nr:glycosyltransferase family 2 protein [Acidobacteriota bacterium]